MGGWIAAIVGFGVFAAAAYKLSADTEDSTVDTPWYVPQGTEDLINEKAAQIQREQKAEVEGALMRAFGKGAVAMVLVGIGIGAWKAGTRPARSGR